MSEQTPLILLSELRRTWKMVRFWEQNNLVSENYVFRSEVREESQDRIIAALEARVQELEQQLASLRFVNMGPGKVIAIGFEDLFEDDDEELPK